ncbi:ankyrin repeat domain-containing protein [Qipengyuania spongiae]|uniref:Ankyrin repeat domain-containing protein n=1 Tax=Qipengyuania spongiae TaxID=2909673 RepID=A0ABY5T2B6_9SPHN|nr:ankyrin repeat domain-containing protein [Qipengyuania spongiae]UVI39468.1 ankyrin repeat domain-containing protein [Qipengyuania spongiae]
MRAIIVSTALIAAVLAPLPAAAQSFSPGYEFLKAVRDRDGDAVTDALSQPGTIIVNTRDIASGESALHIVTQRRDAVWIRFLTAKGANPNIEDKNGTTPLQVAASLGFVEGIEALVKAGARVDVTNSSGETPLISAIHRRDPAMIRLLVKNGANPDRNDNSGRSARDYAQLASGNTQLLEALDSGQQGADGASRSYGPELR